MRPEEIDDDQQDHFSRCCWTERSGRTSVFRDRTGSKFVPQRAQTDLFDAYLASHAN